MATESENASNAWPVFCEGEWHSLIVTPRASYPRLSPQQHGDLVLATVATWMRAWQAIKRDIWTLGDDAKSPEEKLEIAPRTSGEPYVTVYNKDKGLSITVHSHENGQGAIDMAATLGYSYDMLKEKMPQLFQAPDKPKAPPPAKDINDVDSYLSGNATTPQASSPAPQSKPESILHQGNVWVRPAKLGSIAGSAKIEKGAKDKKTWETVILANKPYDHKAVQYQEKDVVLFEIKGAITVKSFDNSRFIDIPTTGASIRIYEREGTVHDGKTIPSDWQSLIKHLGLEAVELPANYVAVAARPNFFVAMQVGKTNDKGEQYKNYKGLYQFEGDSPTPSQAAPQGNDIPF